MQGFRMRRVAEPDNLDDIFQREIDEADLAVLRLAQVRLVAVRGVVDVIVWGWCDHDEIAFVIEPVVDAGNSKWGAGNLQTGAPSYSFAGARTHQIELVAYGLLKVRSPSHSDRIASARLDESVGPRGALNRLLSGQPRLGIEVNHHLSCRISRRKLGSSFQRRRRTPPWTDQPVKSVVCA
jgi:hypothetical protein